MGGFFWVAGAVAGRQIYKYFTNPAFLAPAFLPIFFFVAFALWALFGLRRAEKAG